MTITYIDVVLLFILLSLVALTVWTLILLDKIEDNKISIKILTIVKESKDEYK